MSIWIEIRCEGAGDVAGCFSNRNHGPMALSGDSLKAVAETLRELSGEGERSGWHKRRAGWFCPNCYAIPTPDPHPVPTMEGRHILGADPGDALEAASWIVGQPRSKGPSA